MGVGDGVIVGVGLIAGVVDGSALVVAVGVVVGATKPRSRVTVGMGSSANRLAGLLTDRMSAPKTVSGDNETDQQAAGEASHTMHGSSLCILPCRFQRQDEGESGAGAHFAVDPNAPTLRLDQRFGNG